MPLMCGYGGTQATSGEYDDTPQYSFKGGRWAIDYNYYEVPVNDMSPDVILIEYGHNDAGSTAAVFKTNYKAIIDRLGVKYPGVPIFCLVPFKQGRASDIEECVNDRLNCYLIDTSSYGQSLSTTDGTHLSVIGAEEASVHISSYIISVLSKEFFI